MRLLLPLLLGGSLATGLAAHFVSALPGQAPHQDQDLGTALIGPLSYPAISAPPAIEASLGALENRGWNLDRACTAKHSVLVATPDTGEDVRSWGQTNGFQVTEVLVSLGHGGIEQYSVDLRVECQLRVEAVHSQGRKIFRGMGAIEGARYVTWMAEVAR